MEGERKKMNFNTKYDFGDLLRDIVTGFEGIVMVKALYSTGCLHYGLSPQKMSKQDSNISDPQWIWYDESRLSLVKENVVAFTTRQTSGPSQTKQQETQLNSI